jgi:hypothetical protein
MPLYNTLDCAGNDEQHVHAPCPGGRETEFGRTRQAGFIKSGYLQAILAGAASLNTWLPIWETGIDNGDIIVLPETSGSFDPGTPAELQGFGDRPSSNGPRTMVLTVNDPDYALNYDFYNALAKRTDLVPYYVTSSKIHIFDKPCTAYANNPVEDDLNSQVIWNFQATVISDHLPKFFPIETILSAIKYTPTTVPTAFNAFLDFSSSVNDSDSGVSGTVAVADSDIKFEFNKITPLVGLPATMSVSVGGTQELTVSFQTDYIGKAFRYTDSLGVSHAGVFVNGNVNY